jgi:hypothetical protein
MLVRLTPLGVSSSVAPMLLRQGFACRRSPRCNDLTMQRFDVRSNCQRPYPRRHADGAWGRARKKKGAPAHLFRGILLPTVTNAQDLIPNPGFVKSSVLGPLVPRHLRRKSMRQQIRHGAKRQRTVVDSREQLIPHIRRQQALIPAVRPAHLAACGCSASSRLKRAMLESTRFR